MAADHRAQQGMLAATIGIVVNAFLLVIKAIVGFMIGSLALLADAVDNLGDLLTAVVTLFGFRIGARRADSEHPFGHQRAEEIAALTVGVVLVTVGLQVVYAAVLRLLHPPGGDFSPLALVVVSVSIAAKIALAIYTRVAGKRLRSRALKGSAWNYMGDVVASGLVLGALVARRYGIHWIDPLVALAIAVLIINIGVKIFREASDQLMGRGLDAKLQKEIEEIVKRNPGVVSVGEIEGHVYGRRRRINLRIYVDPQLTVEEADNISEKIQDALMTGHSHWEPIIDVMPAHTDRNPRPGPPP